MLRQPPGASALRSYILKRAARALRTRTLEHEHYTIHWCGLAPTRIRTRIRTRPLLICFSCLRVSSLYGRTGPMWCQRYAQRLLVWTRFSRRAPAPDVWPPPPTLDAHRLGRPPHAAPHTAPAPPLFPRTLKPSPPLVQAWACMPDLRYAARGW
eukprot:scaffold25318_cov117-Isochrysis_galbana.AAC.2